MAITVQVSTISANVVQVSYVGEFNDGRTPGYDLSLTPRVDAADDSWMAPNLWNTEEPVDLRVDVDADPAVIVIDWQAIDDLGAWEESVLDLSPAILNITGDIGDSTTVTFGYYVRETDASGTFDRTITITTGGIVITGGAVETVFDNALESELERV